MLRQCVELREQHGGMQMHASIEDLMTKHGNVVDKTAFKILSEQLHIIHAEQVAQMNKGAADHLGKLIKVFDEILVYIQGNLASAKK